MAARKSLRSNVAKPDTAQKAAEAAQVAQKLAGAKAPPEVQQGPPEQYVDAAGQPLMETVSYHLPVELIEEITELADLRLRKDKRDRREAKRRGEKPEGQARRSGSAVVREALTEHRVKVQAEIDTLRNELGV